MQCYALAEYFALKLLAKFVEDCEQKFTFTLLYNLKMKITRYGPGCILAILLIAFVICIVAILLSKSGFMFWD